MADKSFWQGLGNKLGGGQGAAPLQTSSQKCAKGLHAVSASWKECPYCKAEENANIPSPRPGGDMPAPGSGSSKPTRINAPDLDLGAGAGPSADALDESRRRTRVAAEGQFDTRVDAEAPAAGGGGGGRHRATRVFEPESDAPQAAPRRANEGRRLTGALVTFSWTSLGRLYELHEGRNYVGAGAVAAEGGRPADVLIDSDTQMSNAHFMVLCQNGKYRISDRSSTNGTFVDGQQLDPEVSVELVDGSLIRAGATLLKFYKILPVQAAQESS